MLKEFGKFTGLGQILPAVFGGAATPQASPTDFPKRFIVNKADVSHSANDTIRYARYLRDSLAATGDKGLNEILAYISTYVRQSRDLQQMDNTSYPIYCKRNNGSYPGVLVELARTLPKTPDGIEERRKFLVDHFAISVTLKDHLSQYPYRGAQSLAEDTPSAVWAIRRAMRSLDSANAAIFIRDLAHKLEGEVRRDPHQQLGAMYADFRRQPTIERENKPA